MSGFIERWFGLPGAFAYVFSFYEVLPLIWPNEKSAALLLGLTVYIAGQYTVVRFFDAWAEHLERKAEEKQ